MGLGRTPASRQADPGRPPAKPGKPRNCGCQAGARPDTAGAGAERPHLGWAGLLGRSREELDGSIERRLLVLPPLEHRKLQLFSWRWGPGACHGRAAEGCAARAHSRGCRVQSDLPGGSHSTPGGMRRRRAAGGTRVGSFPQFLPVAPPCPAVGSRPEQSGGRLFFWFVQSAACSAFPCSRRYKAEAEPRSRLGD